MGIRRMEARRTNSFGWATHSNKSAGPSKIKCCIAEQGFTVLLLIKARGKAGTIWRDQN